MKRKKIFGLLIFCVIAVASIFAACNSSGNSEQTSNVDTTYTIMYAYDGTTYTINVKSGDVWSMSSIPQKEGYTFTGLYDLETGGTQYASSSGSCISAFYDNCNIILYPQFSAIQYTISLNYGEASGTVYSEIVEYDGTIPNLPNNLTITGKSYMVFNGWYTEQNGGGIKVAGSNGVCLYTMNDSLRRLCTNANVLQLYAYFETQVYTIKYTYGGEIISTQVSHGESWTLAVPEKEGYTFDGFYDAEIGGVQYAGTNGKALEFFTLDCDLILYPHFSIISYTLKLNYGEANVTVTSVVADYNGTIPDLPSDVIIEDKSYMIFKGWYTEQDGGGTKVTGSNGVAIVSMDAAMRNLCDSDNSLQLYTYFVIQTYSVTLYNADGTLVLLNTTVDHGTDFSTISEGIEDNGKTVISWCEKDETIAFSGTITSNLVLLAMDYSVTVTYNTNGGAAVDAVTVPYGETVTLPSTTKAGYNLIYWYDSNGTQYTGTITPATNITLTAMWSEFDGGSGTTADPYLISTTKQLSLISKYDGYGVFFALIADIDIFGDSWSPISTFKGILDGQNHIISNFTITASTANTGFIGTNNGTIKNLTISNATVSVTRTEDVIVGVLAGVNNGTIENCTVESGSVSGYAKETSNNSNDHARYAVVGGMVGKTSGTITNCTVTTTTVYGFSQRYDGDSVGGSGDIAVAYVGGLVGEVANGGEVINCSVSNMKSITGYGYFRCWHLLTQHPYIKIVVGGVIGILQSGSSYSDCTSDIESSDSILSASYGRKNDGGGSETDNCETHKGEIYGINNSGS